MKQTLVLELVSASAERKAIINLLQHHHLPVEDIDENIQLYSLTGNNEIIGSAGLEIFDDCALLRSVSIIKEKQGKGLGSFINAQIEKIAKQKNISCLYLLTTTASSFFERQGYKAILRTEVPWAIQQTKEFASVCPSSATVMKKQLQ